MGGRSVLQGPHQESVRLMCSNHTAGVKFAQRDQKPPKSNQISPYNPNYLHRLFHRRSRLNSSITTPRGISKFESKHPTLSKYQAKS